MKTLTKKQIIEEGWLLAYITGEVSNEESAAIEVWLSDLEIRTEYENLQIDLHNLISSGAIQPDLKVKRSLFENGNLNENGSISKEPIFLINGWFWAASIVFFMISLGSFVYMFKLWKSAEERLEVVLLQNNHMAEEVKFSNNAVDSLNNTLNFIVLASSKKIILEGTNQATTSKAVIFWNKDKEEIWLNASSMRKLEKGKQYQLWAIVGSTPIDAGVFDGGSIINIKKSIRDAEVFAVTIEKEGGDTKPTLSTLQVIGKIS